MTHFRQKKKKRINAKRRAKLKGLIIQISGIIVICAYFIAFIFHIIDVKQKNNKTIALIDAGNYNAAYSLLEELPEQTKIEIKKKMYNRSMDLIRSGHYDDACQMLDGLNYNDSTNKLMKAALHSSKYGSILSADIGSTISFGTYEQDGNISNGQEPIEWIVLAKESDNILVASKYGLDCQPYNIGYNGVTWETCSLRKWLNGKFLNEAFRQVEQCLIQNAIVKADANPEYNTPSGNDTHDKIFCLSILEAQNYFSSNEARKCHATAYAVSRAVYKDSDTGCCWFRLRSPGSDSFSTAIVDCYGSIVSMGGHVFNGYIAVRPALRIKLQ
ncbi:MAG: DUF6273 domain-containing protein [bacterium]|nr:DUF6273 domain-containing protein [bacterium]